MSTLSALTAWSKNQEEKRARKIDRQLRRFSESGLLDDPINYDEDPRSGVFLVFDQQKIVSIWVGVYIRGQERWEDLGFASALRTPSGIPVLFQRPGRIMVISGARLRRFEREAQRKCVPVPRSFIDALAQGEGSIWRKLPVQRRLDLLDFVVQLYRKTKPEAAA